MKYYGLYIHIPFCRKKCIYCDFTIIDTNNKKNLPIFDEYIELLKKELNIWLNNLKIKTIYIGGGTPSLIGERLLGRLINHIYKITDTSDLVEFTIEANPEDITVEFSKSITPLGINRISLGIQSMNDDDLKTLSRHNTKSINERAIKILQDSGLFNINCDVIFDIPNSLVKNLTYSLETLLKFEIPHISAYGLTVEPYTPLDLFIKKGKVKLKDNFKEEFIMIHKFLESYGFEHYEISNYAKKGFESKHNLSYWNRDEYIGIGISACGFVGGKRYQNEISLKKYRDKLVNNEKPIMFEEEIDNQKTFEEIIMLGFRKKEGFKVEEIKNLLNENEFINFLEKTKKFEGKYLIFKEGRVIPTLEGWIFSDYIIKELCTSF